MVKEGDVLGVVRISYSLEDIDNTVTINTWLNTGLLSLFLSQHLSF